MEAHEMLSENSIYSICDLCNRPAVVAIPSRHGLPSRKGRPAQRGLLNFSVATLLRLERAGAFPRRINMSIGRIGWLKAEVDRWIASKAAERQSVRRAA